MKIKNNKIFFEEDVRFAQNINLSTLQTMVKDKLLVYSHTASRRGYVSRALAGRVEFYKGRFGTGYIVARPRWGTTNYVYIDYYIKLGT